MKFVVLGTLICVVLVTGFLFSHRYSITTNALIVPHGHVIVAIKLDSITGRAWYASVYNNDSFMEIPSMTHWVPITDLVNDAPTNPVAPVKLDLQPVTK